MPKKTKKGKERLDKFYQLAKDQGYRARSAFKLIQLAKKNDFLSKATVCLDLCAAPGGWSQVAVKNMPRGSSVIAIDLAPIKAIPGVTTMQSDITTDKCRSLLKKELMGKRADVVLHDGAPNVGTSWAKDAYMQNELTLHSMKLACEHLRPGGTFVTKVFRSTDYNSLMWVFQQLFNKVEATKPTASRNVSAEIFVLCLGFKAGKIDPRFYDPKWVFMETLEPANKRMEGEKRLSITEHFKQMKKKHRSGYEEGDDHKLMAAHDFIAHDNPAEALVTHHKILLDAEGSEFVKDHPLTTPEIADLLADLKVCGKGDLSILLKWRMKIVRGKEKVEREARKAEKAAADASAADEKAAAKEAKKASLDDAIGDLLDEEAAEINRRVRPAAEEESDDEEDAAADEELEAELAEQVDKRRREEKREAKKTINRQKKAEMRRKMALGQNKESVQDQDLFKSSKKNVKALADAALYLKDKGSDDETEDEAKDDSSDESDDNLDRLLKLEVDVAVDSQLRKMRYAENNRTKAQRIVKLKKETRRQAVLKAWAGEINEFSKAVDVKAENEMALKNKDSDEEDSGDEDSDEEVDEGQKLKRLRALQDRGNSKDSMKSIDGGALEALADGPREEDAEEELPVVPRVEPAEETEADMKDDHRMARWFSQDIFQGTVAKRAASSVSKLLPLDRDSENEESDGEGGKMKEISDSLLPKMPLTDKQRRALKRKKDAERNDARGAYNPGKKSQREAKEQEEEAEPMEVAPLEAPRPIVPTDAEREGELAKDEDGNFVKPSDPKELAETLAFGSVLTHSKKARMDIIDAGYNRWSFEKEDMLPDWFTEEEERFNKPELPVSKEIMAEFRAKLREINARPIRKVTEAKARKKRRLNKRLEKLRSTAMSLADTPDMSEHAKARQMRQAVSKLAKQDERKVTVVAMKKGGGGNRVDKSKVPKGAKVKVVDSRMKSDLRGQRKANVRNKSKMKVQARKQSMKAQKKSGKRKGAKGK